MIAEKLKQIKDTITVFAPKGTKGQLSMTNVIGFFMIIIIVAVLMSPILEMIALAKNGTDAITSLLLDLIPLFLVLAVIMTLFSYSRTHYAG